MIGEILGGNYRLLRLLGQGGMGSVYEAERLDGGERVAIKCIDTGALHRGSNGVVRFQREARATGTIDTEHIVRVLDAQTDPATRAPYLVMELLEGEDLQQLLTRVGALDPDAALRVAAQICLGLQKAHEARVIHRDIKPANIFLARRGGGEILVKLLDFGIAKIKPDPSQGGHITTGLTRSGGLLGSPLYMSPEQARGLKDVDVHTDIWSLGVVLYRALAGKAPHEEIDAFGELIMAICTEVPRPLQEVAPWVQPEVAAVVHGALRLDAGARFASAAAMLDALRALLPGGVDLREELLVPVGESTRATIAPKLATASSASDPGRRIVRVAAGAQQVEGNETTAEAPPSDPDRLAESVAAAGGTATTGPTAVAMSTRERGLAAPEARGAGERPSRGRLGAPAIAAVAGTLGLGAVGLYAMSAPRETAQAIAPAASASSAAIAPAVSAASAAAPPASATSELAGVPAVRRVKVAVMPGDVSVEVDGWPARVEGGEVEIVGALGSAHRVRIFNGKSELTGVVHVTAAGASPPRLALAAATAGPASKPAAKAPAPPKPKPKAPAPPPARTAAGDPLVPESFN
ncbi:protein kinase [Sorangium cellulosum]|uniref:Protein kinase n=1 Tax=Sorangium cellulosum TaxID=56 RepID=A0A2L0EVN7_SORCE|nr:serine/threonine-protein kinase [Sorangium cellulosum]AUX43371.1 protein kinase [Sorangium cellulosum]